MWVRQPVATWLGNRQPCSNLLERCRARERVIRPQVLCQGLRECSSVCDSSRK